jgi:tRNA G18 (ribose-2'-O)-methylase SpoU
MAGVTLEDPDDPRLADYVDLADPDLRRRVEAERGFFIAESPLVVRRLLGSGRRVRSVLVTPAQREVLADVLDRSDVPVYVASDAVLRRVVGFALHRGAVASAERWVLPSVDSVLTGARRVAVLERVNDHENLGVLFRSAAALGIDAILLDAECADPFYRRCVRVSIGTVCTLPWTRIDSLAQVAVPKIALTPRAGATAIGEVAWPPRCALLLGAEGPGLSDAWLRAADLHVRIPMHAGNDSLNVATAASIAFYAARAT